MQYFIFRWIYGMSLRSIISYMIIVVISWNALARYIKNKSKKERLWKLCNILISIAIMVGMVVATLISRTNCDSALILIPLQSFVEARIQPELYRSMLMNVFLFFPLGLALPYILPEKWEHQVLWSIIVAMIVSIGIEFTQYYFHLGRAETDDVICNTLGCAIGTLSYCLSEYKTRRKRVQHEEETKET